MATLLAIDDDAPTCRLLTALFRSEGIDVHAAYDAAGGLARFAAERFDAVLLDLQLPDRDGISVLDELRARDPAVPIVMLTADREVKTAVRAIRQGAFDYLAKPIDQDELIVVVRRALERTAMQRELVELRRRVGGGESASALVARMGHGPEIARVVDEVATVAATTFSVLVVGETGAGKELVAEAIHRASPRNAGPFIALDCGAIPEPLLESELFGHERGAFTGALGKKRGQFQLATGGTVFLDEIANLPLGLQAKLLRVLESRRVQALGANAATDLDVRFVAATNDDLQVRAAGGQFRSDLFFRLAQYTIAVPALRDRRGDIPYLARRFLAEIGVELRRPVVDLDDDALAALDRHVWPGNVRELRNLIRRAVLDTDGGVVTRATIARLLDGADRRLAAAAGDAGPTVKVVSGSLRDIAAAAAREAERQAICRALRAHAGNKTRAARALSTDYKTLHLKMRALGIRARDYSD
jgi:two-component system nitrogen regulation response regulator GlnG